TCGLYPSAPGQVSIVLTHFVMAGLVPGIPAPGPCAAWPVVLLARGQVLASGTAADVDGRDKPGHDGERGSRSADLLQRLCEPPGTSGGRRDGEAHQSPR